MAGRIDELRKRLEGQPGSRLFAQLAEELRKDGQLDEAIRVCRQGLRQHGAYSSAHMTLGRALFDKGELEAARGEFEAVVAAAPDNILAGRLLGECLEGLGEHAAARKRYETTLMLAPDDPQLVGRLEALGSAEGPRAAPGPRSVPPEGMRRAAAQSVVAAAVASARSAEASPGSKPGSEARPAAAQARSGGSIPPARAVVGGGAGAGAGEPGRRAGSVADPAARSGTLTPTRSPMPPAPVEAGGAAAPVETAAPGPASGAAVARPERKEAAPETSDPEEGRPTSRTLPFGTPVPRLPQRPPPNAYGTRGRRAETRPVSVESVKQALEEASGEAGTAAEAPAARSADGELATPTLAELYLKQGYPEKAIEVYRAILERDPGQGEIAARLAEVEREHAQRSARRATLERGIARLERLLGAVQGARRS